MWSVTKFLWTVLLSWIVVMMIYLDLGAGRGFSIFLHTFCLFSWFLDERKWLIHDWCVVHMCRSGRGAGAGCWTPGGSGALRPIQDGWSWCLCSFTTAPNQRTLSPGTQKSQISWPLHIFGNWLIILWKVNSLTFPPVSDLCHDFACVSLDTLLGLEPGHWRYV